MTTPLPRPKKRKKGESGSGGLSKARQVANQNIGSIHDLPADEGEIHEIDPSQICPNPMNARVSLRNMDNLVNDVKANGIHTPGGIMHMEVFAEHYPEWMPKAKHPDRLYMLGPGHRRLEAAERAGRMMLAVLRNEKAQKRQVEQWLLSENKNRDDLTPIEEANQLQLLKESSEMTYEDIAAESGFTKGTISKYLSLLRLAEEVQEAIHDQPLTFRQAQTLASIRDDGADGGRPRNDTPLAHERQCLAWYLMSGPEKLSAEAAKNRVLTSVARKREEFPAGNTTPKPTVPDQRSDQPAKANELPSPAPQSVSRGKRSTPSPSAPEAQPQTAPTATAVVEGAAQPQASEAPAPEPAPDPESESNPAAEAAEARDFACRLLLAEEKYARAEEGTARLLTAALHIAEWEAATHRAHGWLIDCGKADDRQSTSAYYAAVAASGDANLMHRAAFAIGLAADEIRSARPNRDWDERDAAHLTFLSTSRVAYQPTEWEQQQLERVSRGKH